MPRTARAVKPWEAQGVSKSTYFRHKRKAKAATKSKRVTRLLEGAGLKRVSRPPMNESILERSRLAGEAEQRSRHQVIDRDQAIGEAVDKALVGDFVTMLEGILDTAPVEARVIVLRGTPASLAATTRALRKAGY